MTDHHGQKSGLVHLHTETASVERNFMPFKLSGELITS